MKVNSLFIKRFLAVAVSMVLLFGAIAPTGAAATDIGGKASAGDSRQVEKTLHDPVKGNHAHELKLDSDQASMTEKRTIHATFKLPQGGDRDKLAWTYGGKPFSEWKKFKDGGFAGDSFITLDKVDLVNGVIVADITFDLPFDSESLSTNQAYRYWYPTLIGSRELAAVIDGQVVAHAPVKLVPYDSYRGYEELKEEIDEITAQAGKANSRYIHTGSIGQSVEGRDIYRTVLAKNKAAVDKYQTVTHPAMMNNPGQLQAAIQSGKYGDYQVPVWINNVHPDEGPAVDSILNYFKTMALDESISYRSAADGGPSTSVTLNIDEALEHVFFIFVYTANPDGRAHLNRSNANGFDLNRDNSYQTQPETRYLTEEIAKWSPLSFLDMHGFDQNFLIEPSTPPHNPNMEYDLLIDHLLEQAKAMGEAGIANTKYDYYHIPYEEHRKTQEDPDYVSRGTSFGWDDASPAYTAVYAMHHGALGHTLETPELNEESGKALYYAAAAATAYVAGKKEELFFNQLKIYERGVNHSDDRSVDRYLVSGNNEVIGRPRGGDSNFFPDYYVLPVDGSMQKNALEAYRMAAYLLRNGVKVERSTEAVSIAGTTYPSGAFVVNMYQAKRGIANMVLYDGSDISDFEWVTGEIVQNFHDMRGFDRYAVRERDAFAGKTAKVSAVVLPKTQLPGQTRYVRIRNTNNDAVKAVNELLSEGKAVTMLTKSGPGQQAGDFVVEYRDLSPLASKYVLETLAFGNVKPSGNALKATSVAAYGETAYVLRNLGFQVTDDQAVADVLVNTFDSSEYVNAGKPFIGYGLFGMMDIPDWLPGFAYESPENMDRREGLLLTDVEQDHPITGAYGKQEYFYSVSGAYITAVPEGAAVLAAISGEDEFFKAGWWPNHEAAKGKVLAFTYEKDNKHVTVFANDLTNNDHPQHQYRLLANSVFYAAMHNAESIARFADLQSVEEWAGNEIRELAGRGIVNGIAKARFAPLKPVTRAEFLAMLVRAYELPDAKAAVSFMDVQPSDWHYRYVAAAIEARLAQGVGGGRFEPDQAITREDMAVMAANLLKGAGSGKTGIGSEESLIRFKDSEAISEHAREAIAMLTDSGVIRGLTAETYGPRSIVNRAQAAVTISRMLHLNEEYGERSGTDHES